jgi:hypothetical protein
MEEKMDENNGNHRDEKGRFIKGYSGGPGRGKKKVKIDGELLDAIEMVVRSGLGAIELKDRLKAAGIGIRIQSLRKPEADRSVVEPWILRLMYLLDKIPGADPEAQIKAIEDHFETCPDSPIIDIDPDFYEVE